MVCRCLDAQEDLISCTLDYFSSCRDFNSVMVVCQSLLLEILFTKPQFCEMRSSIVAFVIVSIRRQDPGATLYELIQIACTAE